VSTSNHEGRAESSQWYATYKSEKLVARRLSSHGKKLRRLGIFDLPRDARILDLACGAGEALRILRDAGFTNLVGSDVFADPELAKEPWLKVVQADSCAQPFEDGSFDAVVCMHSLHHLGGLVRIRRTAEEAIRILKPGGRLMLLDHYDSIQLRTAFWGLQQSWLTWPTAGLRSFAKQHEEEWPYLYEYLDASHALRATLATLPLVPEVDRRGLFFFYWAGVKRA
jgi:SAM-dependent methyltransferase